MSEYQEAFENYYRNEKVDEPKKFQVGDKINITLNVPMEICYIEGAEKVRAFMKICDCLATLVDKDDNDVAYINGAIGGTPTINYVKGPSICINVPDFYDAITKECVKIGLIGENYLRENLE
jgi:hypothetical protein